MNGGLGTSRKKINFYASCSSRPPERKYSWNIYKDFRELIAGFYEPRQPATIFPAIEIPIALSVFLFVLSAKNIFEVIRWIIYWEKRNRCTERTRFVKAKIWNQEWCERASARRWELTEGNDFSNIGRSSTWRGNKGTLTLSELLRERSAFGILHLSSS